MANAGSRQTPLPYLPDDAERIRQMVATPGAKIVCPQCDEELTMGLPIAGGEGHDRTCVAVAMCVLRPESPPYRSPGATT